MAATATATAAPARAVAREPVTYTVAEGDTVLALAQRFGVSASTLVKTNGLADPERLQPGQDLVVLPISGTQHVVAEGDTIVGLAEKYGVIPEEIIAVNSLAEPYSIFPGQKLLIPEVSEEERQAPTSPGAPSPVEVQRPSSYKVVAGDTLASIAGRAGVSLEILTTANGLDAAQPLKVGQQLVLPPAGAALHVVQPGDTVTGVAARYAASAVEIVRANGLSEPYVLELGRQLVVPGGTPPSRVQPTPTPTATKTPPRPTATPTATPRSAVVAAAAPPKAPAPTATPKPPAPAPAPKPASPRSAVTGDQAVGVAMKYLGSRYVFGGTTPSGFDCSGFVMYVLRQAGLAVPRDLWGQLNSGARVSRSELRPGDLVFFQNTYKPGLSHVGFYVGGGSFVHAASENTGVIVTRLDSAYWSARYYAATRPY